MAAGTAAVAFFHNNNPYAGIATIAATLLNLGAWLGKASAEAKKEVIQTDVPLDLTACVRVLHEVARNLKKTPSESELKLRATFHRQHPERAGRLEQCINYVGGDGDGVAWG